MSSQLLCLNAPCALPDQAASRCKNGPDSASGFRLTWVAGTDPTAAPRRYVEALCDDYAADFEFHVVGKLGYRELIHADLGEFLAVTALRADLILVADVFIYVGDLADEARFTGVRIFEAPIRHDQTTPVMGLYVYLE